MCFSHNEQKSKIQLTMFSSLEAVLVHLRWVAGDVLSGTNAGALLYITASLSNSLACCGNWRSWGSKHQRLRWKMRRKSTKKKIYWYAPLQRSKEHCLLLHRWPSASNDPSVCEIWCVSVCHLLKCHTLDLRYVSWSYFAEQCTIGEQVGVQTCSSTFQHPVYFPAHG